MSAEPLLSVTDLVKHYPITQGIIREKQVGAVRAVDGVSFDVQKGETLGLVGESGCGKSTTGRLLMRLEQPTSGSIRFEGDDWLSLSRKDLRQARKDMQIVFQDPFSSLNPRMTVGEIVGEPLLCTGGEGRRPERKTARLGSSRADESHARRYPHEFSEASASDGVARALSLNPRLIILDEPVSALDVSGRSSGHQPAPRPAARLRLTYSSSPTTWRCAPHRQSSGRDVLGRSSSWPARPSYANPVHPYTEALLSLCMPDPWPAERGYASSLKETPSP